MKINFKKVSAIAASALMVGMTMGTAVAAYPTPFVSSGASNVAIVYGTQAGFADGSPLDVAQAGTINSDLSGRMGSTGSSTSVTGGDNWQVETGSDILEIGESINDVTSYLGSNDLGLLSDQTISTEKGEALYEQFLYFDDTTSSSVIYTEDDEDNLGLFFKITSGQLIARYVMDFSTNLKSDVESDGKLSDIEDKSITFLGKTYTITSANNGTGVGGTELTLMSGALGGTVSQGTPVTVGGYTVDVVVSSTTEAKFTITSASGTEVTDKMNKGEIEKLADGNYIAITDLTYEGYETGSKSATFYIGADKLEWKNGQSMTVNGETISDAKVTITDTESGGDISISEITLNMTAEDDLYVPAGKKLSEATDLDEPQVLVSQNWDIQFAGLEAADYEELSLDLLGSDNRYELEFVNYNGDTVKLPLVFTNGSGVYGGENDDKRFVVDPTGHASTNVSKNDYFLLHTADPKLATSDAKTVLVQYKGADKATDTNPQVTFAINPGSNEYEEKMTLTSTATTSVGTFTLKVAGGTFTFASDGNASLADDFSIQYTGTSYSSVNSNMNGSTSNYIRTRYNTLLNISEIIPTVANATATGTPATSWKINVTTDDTNRDGDHATVPQQVFYATIGNTSTDATLTYTANSAWKTDPDENTVQKYTTTYGTEITSTDPSDAPASIVVKVPKSIVKPLVYVTSKEGVSVSTTTGTAGSLGYILVKDSEVSSVSSKNLIVVGGSCINSVAAKLVGAASCGADFTTKTGIGSGQFLIQSYANPYTSGKVALLVAGYDAVDTKNAATYLTTKDVDTTVGKKYKGTSATTAELVVA